MTQIDTVTRDRAEQVNQRLEELRRLFDDDIRCVPAEKNQNTQEFLLLTLAGEVYAYPVMHVLEVVQVPTIVPVPGMPPTIPGIINFRGQILSVTMIHGLLGLTAGKIGSRSRVIVTKGLPLVTGFLADSVEKIAEVTADDIRSLPVTFGEEKVRLLAGQIYVDKQVVFLLDMEQLCKSDSLCATRSDLVN